MVGVHTDQTQQIKNANHLNKRSYNLSLFGRILSSSQMVGGDTDHGGRDIKDWQEEDTIIPTTFKRLPPPSL